MLSDQVVLVPLLIALAVAVGLSARQKGHDGIVWFVVSLLLTPVVTGLVILLMPSKKANLKGMGICPFCAELIKAEAVVCRYCGRELQAPAALQEQR